MKTLSFNIQYNRPTVTGDSTKNTLVETDKFFVLHSPYYIFFDTDKNRQKFLADFLQENHDYLLVDEDLVIEGIPFKFDPRGLIISTTTNRNFAIPEGGPRNLFKLYEDFYRFLVEVKQLNNVTGFIESILGEKDMRKRVERIDDSIRGLIITVTNTTWKSSLTPDFQLLLDTNNQLHFLHFYEPEGEYYSSGESPISRNRLQEEVNQAIRMLNLHDEFVVFFNRTMKLNL